MSAPDPAGPGFEGGRSMSTGKALDGAGLRRREVEAMEAHAEATARCADAMERVADLLSSVVESGHPAHEPHVRTRP